MKTLTIISALSLALIITSVNAGFAKQNGKSGEPKQNATIWVKYQVTVNLVLITPLCNNYQVQVLDGNGRLVAPPQTFVPGKAIYNFDEHTSQTAGIRIARLVLIPFPGPEHYVCDQELFTAPDVHLLNFKNGEVYPFNLYPKPRQPK